MLNFLRRYGMHFIIAVIGVAVYAVLFGLFAEDVSGDCSVIYRTSTMQNNEIVFSTVYSEGETFYNLNGGCYVYTSGNSRIVADVFMEIPDTKYDDNSLLYMGDAGDGGCAISANIMAEYGLKIGDIITVGDTPFIITRKLTAQGGADVSYGYGGVVVLSYSGQALSSVTSLSYVTYLTDGDAYPGLKNLVYVGDLNSEAVSGLVTSSLIQLAVWCVFMAVCEFFLFKRRRKDYAILYGDGIPRGRLYLTIFAEMCLKYVLPMAITAAVWLCILYCYGWLFAIPAIIYTAVIAVICAAASYLFLKRIK